MMLVFFESLYAAISWTSISSILPKLSRLVGFCPPEKLMDLRNEYLEADETTKRFLEQRYGKRVIQKALEEMESKEWLEKNSKSCPCCGTHIEVSVEGKAGESWNRK